MAQGLSKYEETEQQQVPCGSLSGPTTHATPTSGDGIPWPLLELGRASLRGMLASDTAAIPCLNGKGVPKGHGTLPVNAMWLVCLQSHD